MNSKNNGIPRRCSARPEASLFGATLHAPRDDKKGNPKIIVILGPTASGKTGWAFKLCEEFGGEIVSADSRQIYRGMDIGTNKTRNPKPETRNQKPENFGIRDSGFEIREHLIDIVNPDEILTLSQYKKLAINAINDILSRGKIPFLVGGTGLYISAVIDNLEIPEVEPNWGLREKLELKNISELQDELKKLDPASYKEIDLDNKRRLIRAIEVCKATGNPFSEMRKKGAPLFDVLQIGIDIPREELNKKINARVDEMKKAGLEEEARKLAKKYSWDLPSMSGIGYREFRSPLLSEEPLLWKEGAGGGFRGKWARQEILFSRKNHPLIPSFQRRGDLGEIFDEIKKHTRQYAKRQMTWFHRDSRIEWIKDYNETKKKIEEFLKKDIRY